MRTRLIPAFTAIKGLTLLTLASVGVGALIFAPALWLVFALWVSKNGDPFFAYLAIPYLLLAWSIVISVSVSAWKAIPPKTPRNKGSPLIELPLERHPLAAELARFIESSCKGLKGKLRVSLSLAPAVFFIRDSRTGLWQLGLGLPVIALLSIEEIKALSLRQANEKLCPVTPFHPWMERVYNSASLAQKALPPHPGAFSLTHNLLNFLANLLRPVPGEQREWSRLQTLRQVSPTVFQQAVEKAVAIQRFAMSYFALYRSALVAGGMPPFAEGFFRLVSKAQPSLAAAEPVFKRIESLWVYERRALAAQHLAGDCKLVAWDGFSGDLAADSWKKTAALLRPVLRGKRASDIPELVARWRDLARLSIGANIRMFTPDVQKGVVLQSLASAFAIVLADAGWELTSSLGEEFNFRKDAREFRPFRLIKDLESGALPGPDFIQACQEAATAHLPLC
jgi:hypothetical protein